LEWSKRIGWFTSRFSGSQAQYFSWSSVSESNRILTLCIVSNSSPTYLPFWGIFWTWTWKPSVGIIETATTTYTLLSNNKSISCLCLSTWDFLIFWGKSLPWASRVSCASICEKPRISHHGPLNTQSTSTFFTCFQSQLMPSMFLFNRLQGNVVTFKVEPNDRGLNASEVAKRIGKLIWHDSNISFNSGTLFRTIIRLIWLQNP